MFGAIGELDVSALSKVLRRTVIISLILGAVGVIAALFFSPWAGIGVALGIAAALVNLRFLDAGVAKVQTRGEPNGKVVRRILGTRTATRLAILTGIVIGLVVLLAPLGIGMAVGLVIFQIVFVMNMAKTILSGVA